MAKIVDFRDELFGSCFSVFNKHFEKFISDFSKGSHSNKWYMVKYDNNLRKIKFRFYPEKLKNTYSYYLAVEDYLYENQEWYHEQDFIYKVILESFEVFEPQNFSVVKLGSVGASSYAFGKSYKEDIKNLKQLKFFLSLMNQKEKR